MHSLQIKIHLPQILLGHLLMLPYLVTQPLRLDGLVTKVKSKQIPNRKALPNNMGRDCGGNQPTSHEGFVIDRSSNQR
ncbi:hypothetical protein HanRHA438_Chr10g0439951 [Helianthus annuus]|nr:hypothetical protein HanRHA438_Chr10g0439951 [Helianthus annuus]